MGPSDHIDISSVNRKTVNQDQARSLIAPITDVLIWDTIKSMKKNKAPGPDGVNVEFFLSTWHITGPSFCAAVKHFFATGFLLPGINSPSYLSFLKLFLPPL